MDDQLKTDGKQTFTRGLCIVSGADRVRYRSHVNHAAYAQSFGFDYRFDFGVAEVPLGSHFDIKLRALQRLLPHYEWVLWIDDDVYFTDFRAGALTEILDEADERGTPIVIAEGAVEPQGFASFINSGVILLKNSAEAAELLSRALAEPVDGVCEWWNEDEYGIFTAGDQDQLVKVLVESGLIDACWRVDPQRLNSRTHLYSASASDAFACHFCGHYDRELSIAQFAERWNLSPDLLPPAVAARFAPDAAHMPQAERTLREKRRELRGRLKPYVKPLVVRARSLKERVSALSR